MVVDDDMHVEVRLEERPVGVLAGARLEPRVRAVRGACLDVIYSIQRTSFVLIRVFAVCVYSSKSA